MTRFMQGTGDRGTGQSSMYCRSSLLTAAMLTVALLLPVGPAGCGCKQDRTAGKGALTVQLQGLCEPGMQPLTTRALTEAAAAAAEAAAACRRQQGKHQS